MTSSIVLTKPLAIPPKKITGLASTVINGQPMMTFDDPLRSNKTLSISEQNRTFSRNSVRNSDWLRVDNTAHTEAGFVAEFDGTVCYASAHCEETNDKSKDIHLFIDEVDKGSIGTLTGGENATFTNTSLDFDYTQGQRIRLQAFDTEGSTSGKIEDTVVTVTIKHRAENTAPALKIKGLNIP